MDVIHPPISTPRPRPATPTNQQQSKFSLFCKTYFCEGQELSSFEKDKMKNPEYEKRFVNRHRRLIGMAVPFILVQIAWWAYMISEDRLALFTGLSGKSQIPRWYMSVTMIFGSMIAGATSEGGASVAFPVMTLAFGITPAVARDFSFMIQSVGMTAAAFTIFFMKVTYLPWT
jgi:hypothetical protein